jgi:hypothetical protein
VDENNGILNLDELLGRSKMKVRYQGAEYGLKTVTALTPDEYALVMEFSQKFANIETGTAMSGKDLQDVLRAVDDFIEIIAPGMPRHTPTLKERFGKGYRRRFTLSLQECVAILQFWVQQTKNAQGAVTPAETRPRHNPRK